MKIGVLPYWSDGIIKYWNVGMVDMDQ